MSWLDIIFLALGVSLDSFAICVCKGISAKNRLKLALECAICFAAFQFIMPIIGYFLGQSFERFIDSFDHYIVFGILLIFGANMIKEGFSKEEKPQKNGLFSIMLLALLSSLDSLGVGLSLAFFGSEVFISSIIICLLTFVFSFFGVLIGKYCGQKHKKIACIIGGIILILLGIKILIEHLF